MTDYKLLGIISFVDELRKQARLMQAVTDEVLFEQVLKYLRELRKLKEKGAKDEVSSNL